MDTCTKVFKKLKCPFAYESNTFTCLLFFLLFIDGETEYHRMCDTDPGRQCIVNEEWHSVRCYCNTDNCNADEKCNCDDSTTTTQVPETTSITDGATDLTLSMSVFLASLIIRNF